MASTRDAVHLEHRVSTSAQVLEWRPVTATETAWFGKTALPVWQALLTTRDSFGVTHITLAGIQRLLNNRLTEPQIRRALARLRQLGLVEDTGWAHAFVPLTVNGKVIEDVREVYNRKVHGEWRNGQAGLPADLWDRLALSKTHGGVRIGAGRPNKSNRTPTDTVCENAVKTSEKIKPHDRIENIRSSSSESLVCFPTGNKRGAQRRLLSETTTEADMDTLLPITTDAQGSFLIGAGRPSVVPATSSADLPPFPGIGVIQPATVPAPPLVDSDSSKTLKAQQLMDAYDMTLKRKLPKQWNPHTQHGLKVNERKLLLQAADALAVQQVSPLRWCEFSFDVYAKGRELDAESGKGQRSERPPMRVVYALKRIEETAGWARTEYERRGERVILTRTWATLIGKWRKMMADVLSGGCTPDTAKTRHFPADSYSRLVAKANAEARQEQQNVSARLASGEYLW